jgi:hypothetical protein
MHVNTSSRKACEETFSPDGLDESAIDALIAEVAAHIAEAPTPTSALIDGSAAERRRWRIQRRALTAVIRSLPVRPAAPTHIEEIAS